MLVLALSKFEQIDVHFPQNHQKTIREQKLIGLVKSTSYIKEEIWQRAPRCYHSILSFELKINTKLYNNPWNSMHKF